MVASLEGKTLFYRSVVLVVDDDDDDDDGDLHAGYECTWLKLAVF